MTNQVNHLMATEQQAQILHKTVPKSSIAVSNVFSAVLTPVRGAVTEEVQRQLQLTQGEHVHLNHYVRYMLMWARYSRFHATSRFL